MSYWRRGVVALVLGLVLATVAWAGDLELTQVSLPAPFLEDGKLNHVIEASGVAPIGDGGRYLLAHDKAPPLYVVELNTGRILGAPLTSPRFPVQNGAGPKWEGLTLDSQGVYYIIGAHNGKTDEERATKSHLLSFRLKDVDANPSIDDGSVTVYHAAAALEAALKAQGVSAGLLARRKVEGLAIRERTGKDGSIARELVIGLREPKDRVRGFAADFSTPPSPGTELELKQVFSFEAEPCEGVQSELTALEYCKALKGFLVMTATEDKDNAFHGNTLWFVADDAPEHAQKIRVLAPAMKAEGLTILSTQTGAGETRVQLLITYDNDYHATHIPSRFQTAVLVKK